MLHTRPALCIVKIRITAYHCMAGHTHHGHAYSQMATD